MAAAPQRDDERFWEVVEPFLGAGRLEEGTIMSSRCVRADGEFVAMAEHRVGDLVVKLPKQRVQELIAEGAGLPFAPAKRVFSEWVQVPQTEHERWEALIDESIDFVGGGS